MDIFTTQLTRVVPVPIKPASLKVKALLKDAASPKLREDHDHLENHDNYFDDDEEKGEQYHANHQENSHQKNHENNHKKNEKEQQDQQTLTKHKSLVTKAADETASKVSPKKIANKKTDDKDKHLDLYA